MVTERFAETRIEFFIILDISSSHTSVPLFSIVQGIRELYLRNYHRRDLN
jgi:hypothetical protein